MFAPGNADTFSQFGEGSVQTCIVPLVEVLHKRALFIFAQAPFAGLVMQKRELSSSV